MSSISAIVALSLNRAIGKNGQLLWHLPNDLKHFKALTSGHTIIMGRKTYESIGASLSNRRNMVITRNENFKAPDCEVYFSLEEAFKQAQTSTVFIIGGADIYRAAMPYIQTIYLTKVHEHFDGDTFFPELDEAWKEISVTHHLKDARHAYDYSFYVFEKQAA